MAVGTVLQNAKNDMKTSAFHRLRRLLCRLGTTGRIKIATDVGATNMKEKGMRNVHPLYVSCHLLILFFHLLFFHHHNFTIPLALSTRYNDVRSPSHHSGEFVVAFRPSMFINIISASRIYLGPNSGICHSKFIRGRKPLNSIGIQRWRMKSTCLETFNSI